MLRKSFRNNLIGSSILCTAALIWGMAFVAQSKAAESVPPFAFNAFRSFLGSAFLLLLIFLRKATKKTVVLPDRRTLGRSYLPAGALCGVFLAISVNLQQAGISSYPAGTASSARAGFLTALYVILVPLFSIFGRKKIKLPILLSAVVAMVGIYFLSLSGGIDGVYFGDVLMFFCAVSFTLHILVIDRFGGPLMTRDGADVPTVGMLLSMIQFFVCGIVSAILALCFETIPWDGVVAALPQILYIGIVSSGIAYTLQIVGQRFAEPAIASLSMSLESVFAALGGWIILGNILSTRELLGCVLVFLAIVSAQIPQFFAKGEGDPTKGSESE